MGWVVSATPPPLCPWVRDAVHILQEARWVSGPMWTGLENLAPIGLWRVAIPTELSRPTGCGTQKYCTLRVLVLLRDTVLFTGVIGQYQGLHCVGHCRKCRA